MTHVAPRIAFSSAFALAVLVVAFSLLAPPPAHAGGVVVTLQGVSFDPQVVTIDVGDTVTWMNVQGIHNVDADDGSFRSGDPAGAPWTYSHTFTQIGTFNYHCDVHLGVGMTGTVIVEQSGGGGGGGGGGGDNPGSVQLGNASYTVAEGAGSLTVIIQRVGGDDGALSARLTTEDGSATAGEDYTAVDTTIAFPDNDDTPKQFQIPILDDSAMEGEESFTVRLSNVVGGALGVPNSAAATITDDDDAPPPTDCVEDEFTSCLLNGRFQVTVDFFANDQINGQAKRVELSDRSVLFYFTNQSNIEMLFKMLDACDTAFNSFWVFYAATTNFEFQVRVVDTVAGTMKVYENPLDTAALPEQDTSAFETCP